MTAAGKALVRDYLSEVFSEGRLDRLPERLDGDRFGDGFLEEDEMGLLQQPGALELPSETARGRHSPLAKPPERIP